MKSIVLAVLSLFIASAAFAESVSVYVENDMFYQRDYDYTHGTKISYTDDDNWEYYLWQGIYTPQEKHTEVVMPGDRPYAGWLAFGVARQYEWRSMHQETDVSLGVVGPDSFSEEAQIHIHKITGSYIPIGWDDQLKNEPAITVRQEAKKALWIYQGDVSLAFVPQGEVVVGTVMDYVGIGGDIIFGHNPNPYLKNQITMKGLEDKWGAYLFTGVRGRAVAWNMLLDGNMWHDSPSVDKEVFVGDFQYGACLTTPWFSAVFTAVVRSKEFETQDQPEKFGSMLLTAYF